MCRRLCPGQIVVEIETLALIGGELGQLVQLCQRQGAALAPFVDGSTLHRLIGKGRRQRFRERTGSTKILDQTFDVQLHAAAPCLLWLNLTFRPTRCQILLANFVAIRKNVLSNHKNQTKCRIQKQNKGDLSRLCPFRRITAPCLSYACGGSSGAVFLPHPSSAIT